MPVNAVDLITLFIFHRAQKLAKLSTPSTCSFFENLRKNTRIFVITRSIANLVCVGAGCAPHFFRVE